jgi:hypothetical protein
LHGFAREFARDLRARGIEAWALTGTNQLELTLSLPVAELSRPAATAASPDDTGFNAFCLVSEAIRGTTGKLEKTRILSGYFQSLDDTGLALAAGAHCNSALGGGLGASGPQTLTPPGGP